MELIDQKTHINFLRWKKVGILFSSALLALSLLSFAVQGLNFGIDFSGGTLIQVRFPDPPKVTQLRESLSSLGLGDVVIQEFGTPDEMLIRVEQQMLDEEAQNALTIKVLDTVKTASGADSVELRRVEFVGPQVGEELTQSGILAVLYSMFAILAYVSWRFHWRFAVGSVLALIHDVTLTLGLFSILQKEFTLVVVAALLTVIGYSLNDTIVVFDRVREETKRLKKQPMIHIINEAINRTLSRTLVTSLTTVLVLIALLLFGGEVIHDFAFTLFAGVVVGTYSSIFVASTAVLMLGEETPSRAAVKRKAAAADAIDGGADGAPDAAADGPTVQGASTGASSIPVSDVLSRPESAATAQNRGPSKNRGGKSWSGGTRKMRGQGTGKRYKRKSGAGS